VSAEFGRIQQLESDLTAAHATLDTARANGSARAVGPAAATVKILQSELAEARGLTPRHDEIEAEPEAGL
jgi:hypothetical protein